MALYGKIFLFTYLKDFLKVFKDQSFIFIEFWSDIPRYREFAFETRDGQLTNRTRINVKSALNNVIMDRNAIKGTIPMCWIDPNIRICNQ